MTHRQALIGKFGDRSARIGILGLGYVGLPLALRFNEVGYRVLGLDSDAMKIESIGMGRSYLNHISDDLVAKSVASGLRCTADLSEVSNVDAIISCLPTPLGSHHEPDLGYVTRTLDEMLPFLKAGQIFCLESTTYPGTTDEELVPRIERMGFEVGADFFVAYSPEREDPGNRDFTTASIPKVVSGSTENCLAVAMALYGNVIDRLVPVSSPRVAEMTKLLENIHRSVNVGLINEMKIVADAMEIDIFEVISAASTKPFGFVPYYPGPGLGGHCLPIDPYYLTWKAKEFGVSTRFIELSGEVNQGMPHWIVGKIIRALNTRSMAVQGSRILVLGVAYKKNVGDTRESPAVEIMQQLSDLGGTVSYSDPHVPHLGPMRRYDMPLSSLTLNQNALLDADLVVIATDHDLFDYDMVTKFSKLIVDTRGRLVPSAHIIRC